MPFGREKISVGMVDSVVVNPETRSNHALIISNSPPHIKKGSIPIIQAASHSKITIINPSMGEIAETLLTKIIGKTPSENVIKALNRRGIKEVFRYPADINAEILMKMAQKSNTCPMH